MIIPIEMKKGKDGVWRISHTQNSYISFEEAADYLRDRIGVPVYIFDEVMETKDAKPTRDRHRGLPPKR